MRYVFSRGDYIQYNGGDCFGRIDQIFTFDVYGDTHIFAIITPLQRTGERDRLLELEVLREMEDEPTIIGITAIEPFKPYLVDVANVGVVNVDWSVRWL